MKPRVTFFRIGIHYDEEWLEFLESSGFHMEAAQASDRRNDNSKEPRREWLLREGSLRCEVNVIQEKPSGEFLLYIMTTRTCDEPLAIRIEGALAKMGMTPMDSA